jgi:hypothetical protein
MRIVCIAKSVFPSYQYENAERHNCRCLCPKKANEADLQGVQIEQNTDTSTTFSFSETEPRELIRVPNHNLENATREYASQQSSLPRSSDAQEAALAGAGQPSVTSDHSLTTLETSPALHSSHPQQQQLHRRANDAGSAEQLQEAGGRQARDVAEEGRHKGGVGEHKSRQNKAKSVAEKVPRVRPEAPGKVHGSASSNENEARAKLERTWSAQSHGEAPSFSGRASPPSRSAALPPPPPLPLMRCSKKCPPPYEMPVKSAKRHPSRSP